MSSLFDIAVSFAQVVVGSSLVYAGVLKLRDLEGSRIAVLDYRLVPAPMAGPVALLLGALEVLIGVALIAGVTFAAHVGIALLGLFSIAAGSALARGLRIDCHCFGEGERLSVTTLLRNAAFVALLSPAVLHPIPTLLIPQLLVAPLPHVLSILLAVATLAALVAVLQISRPHMPRVALTGR